MKKGLIAILTIILLSSFLLSIFLPSLALNELEDEIWIEEDTEVIHENDTDDNSDIDYITPDNGHDSEDNIVPDIEEGHVDTGDAGTDDINTDVNVENDSNTPDSEQDLDERIDDEYLDEHEEYTEIMQTSESVFNVPSDFTVVNMGTGPGMTPGFGDAMRDNPGNLVLVLHGNFNWSSELVISGNRHFIITSAGTDLLTHTNDGPIFTITRTGSGGRHFWMSTNSPSLTLSNIILNGGNPGAGTTRGGVGVSTGILYLEDGAVIRNNRNTVRGAGVTVSGQNAQVIMNGGIIENNVAANGGGVVVAGGGRFHMYGGIIGREIDGNLTASTAGNHASSEGGGVLVTDRDSTFNLHDGIIAGNTAQTHGGGIRVHHHGNLYISEGESLISNNWSLGSGDTRGGGVSITAGANVEVHGGTIENNRALRGGGIMVDAGLSGGAAVGTLTIHGGTIRNNRLQANGNPILEGGGLWVGQGQIGGNLPSHVTILGGEIYGNSANQGGGASVGQGGSLTIDLYGSSIHSNESTNNGGGVWVSGTGGAFRSTLRLIRGSIENNTAANSGGGVFVGVGGIFNMDDGNDRTTIENNHAQQGGGVHVEGGNFNMYGGAIRNNRYDASGQVIARGGGVSLGNVLQNVVHFNMTGGEISNNTANEGGGIRINGSAPNSTFNITGGTIKNNDAIGTGVTHGGGGLWISVNARVNMMDTDIIGNSATDALNGGGVWIGRSNGGSAANAVDRGTLTMTGGTITGNIANGDGGGVWVGGNGAEFTMTDVAIDEDNTATNGGGVWVGGWVSGTGQNMTNPVRLTMNGESSISGNIATGVYADNGGGGVYVSGENARFDMNSGRIDGNRAFRGGGIHILGNAIFSGTAGAITNNIATDDGGGMYVHYIFPDNLTNLNGVTIVPAFTFSNNEALNGLGINNELGLAQRPRIDPNIVTLSGEIIIDRVPANSETFATIRPHAFTNHDINAEGTMWRVTHEIRRGYVEGQTEISAIVGTNNHLVPSGALLPDGAIVTFNALPEEYFEYWRITTRPREVDEQGNPVDYTFLRNETDHNFPQAITAHTHVAANFISDSILTISKEVTGELANLTLEFLFTLYITDADGELLPTGTEFDFTGGVVDNINAIAPPDGVLTVNDYGIIEFWLGHGQSKSIDNIPVHLYVRVVESPHPGYEASFMDTEYYGVDVPGNDTGTRPMVAEREFNFTNDRFVPPPTGLSSDNTGVVLLLSTLVLLVGVATFAINKKSKLARNVNINLK